MPAKTNTSECWSSTDGKTSIKTILTAALPQWTNGPRDWQVNATAAVLDGHDQLLVAGCGEGKTAAAYLHLLVRHELLWKPSLPRYGAKVPPKPVVLMISDRSWSMSCK